MARQRAVLTLFFDYPAEFSDYEIRSDVVRRTTELARRHELEEYIDISESEAEDTGRRDYLDYTCPYCGDEHEPCKACGNPTHCSPDEPGEAFDYCDSCDGDIAQADHFGSAS